MTDHISPDRMDVAVENAYIVFTGREYVRGGHRQDDMRAAITAALPDLLADRDAEVKRLRIVRDVLRSQRDGVDDAVKVARTDLAAALARVDAITEAVTGLADELSRDRRNGRAAERSLYEEGYGEGHYDSRIEAGKKLLAVLAVLAEHAGAKP